jgi:hypothetical protein
MVINVIAGIADKNKPGAENVNEKVMFYYDFENEII